MIKNKRFSQKPTSVRPFSTERLQDIDLTVSKVLPPEKPSSRWLYSFPLIDYLKGKFGSVSRKLNNLLNNYKDIPVHALKPGPQNNAPQEICRVKMPSIVSPIKPVPLKRPGKMPASQRNRELFRRRAKFMNVVNYHKDIFINKLRENAKIGNVYSVLGGDVNTVRPVPKYPNVNLQVDNEKIRLELPPTKSKEEYRLPVAKKLNLPGNSQPLRRKRRNLFILTNMRSIDSDDDYTISPVIKEGSEPVFRDPELAILNQPVKKIVRNDGTLVKKEVEESKNMVQTTNKTAKINSFLSKKLQVKPPKAKAVNLDAQIHMDHQKVNDNSSSVSEQMMIDSRMDTDADENGGTNNNEQIQEEHNFFKKPNLHAKRFNEQNIEIEVSKEKPSANEISNLKQEAPLLFGENNSNTNDRDNQIPKIDRNFLQYTDSFNKYSYEKLNTIDDHQQALPNMNTDKLTEENPFRPKFEWIPLKLRKKEADAEEIGKEKPAKTFIETELFDINNKLLISKDQNRPQIQETKSLKTFTKGVFTNIFQKIRGRPSLPSSEKQADENEIQNSFYSEKAVRKVVVPSLKVLQGPSSDFHKPFGYQTNNFKPLNQFNQDQPEEKDEINFDLGLLKRANSIWNEKFQSYTRQILPSEEFDIGLNAENDQLCKFESKPFEESNNRIPSIFNQPNQDAFVRMEEKDVNPVDCRKTSPILSNMTSPLKRPRFTPVFGNKLTVSTLRFHRNNIEQP